MVKGKNIEISPLLDYKKMTYFTYAEIKGPKKDNPFNYHISMERRKKAWEPNKYKNHSGIYFLMDGKTLIYVGKTIKLAGRVKTHKRNFRSLDGLYFLPIERGWEMDVLERLYIEKYSPKYNKSGMEEVQT